MSGETIGLLAAIVGVCAFVPYILAIFGRGLRLGRDLRLSRVERTRPERVTWFIWLILGTELLVMNYLLGADHSLPLLTAYVVAYLVISVLSIKYGVGGWTPLNVGCLVGGLLGAGVWLVLKVYGSSETAAIAAIGVAGVADICAFLPTILHTWQKPFEESRVAWTLGLCGAILNLFTLTYALDWTIFAVAFFPLYNAFFMGVIVIAVWFSPYRARSHQLRPA